MIAKFIIIAWTIFLAYGFITGLGNMFATNPSDEVAGIAMLFGMIFHLMLWLMVALPTYMISRLFRRSATTSH